MKAFICLALVACVAARNLDIDGLRLVKDSSLSHHRFGQKSLWGQESGLDTVREWGQDVNRWDKRRVSILSFEEIVQTNLFRSYYQIPLFRQYLTQYPVIFRRYIESPMFQDLWKFQQFQQYFRNPVLFYKYIVPQVQIFSQQEDIFSQEYPTYNFERRNTFGQESLVDEILNRNVVDRREVVVGDYLKQLLKGQFQTGYGYNTIVPYTTRYAHQYGRDVATTPVNYKFLLDKIYRTLFLNKPVQGEVTQVKTDVKIAPAHEKLVVEPITGETKVVVQEPKIVDVQVVEQVIPEHKAVSEIHREVLIKEILLRKLVVSKRISYELYTILKTLPLAHVKEVVRKHLGEYEYVALINEVETPFLTQRDVETTPFITRDLESTPFLTRDLESTPFEFRGLNKFNHHQQGKYEQLIKELYNNETPFLTRDVETTPFITRDLESTPFAFRGLNKFNHQQQNVKYDQLIKELYNNEIVGDRVVPTLRELYQTYGQQVRV